MTVNMWLVLTLTSAFLFAVAGILLKKGYGEFSPKATYFLSGLSCVVIWVAYAFLRGGLNFSYQAWPDIWYLLQPIGYLLYLQALNKGNISLVSTITACSPALVVILSFLFLAERLGGGQIGLVLLVIGGVVLAGLSKESLKEFKNSKSESWLFWAGLATLGFAINQVMSKALLTANGVANFFFNVGLVNLLYALVWIKRRPANWQRYKKMGKKSFLPTVVGTVLMSLAPLPFFEALDMASASLVATVGNVSLPLTVILAYFFLREELTKWQMLGIGIVVVGVMMLG